MTKIAPFTALCIALAICLHVAPQAVHGSCADRHGGPGNATDIYLVVMGPLYSVSESLGYDAGIELYAAAQLAANHINNSTEVLCKYRLRILEADSGCRLELKATVDFVRHMVHVHQRPVVGIIGPACSGAALTIAPLGTRSNRIQIVTGTSPLLSNGALYPYTYKAVSSSLAYVGAIVELMREKAWKRVAVLFDGSRLYFQSTFNAFVRRLSSEPEVGEIVYASAVYDSYIPLSELKQQRVRVIINFLDKDRALKVACLAHHRRVTYPTYQWVWIDRHVPGHFNTETDVEDDSRSYHCTPKDMQSALVGSILHTNRLERPDDTYTGTQAGISFKQYNEEYVRLYMEKYTERDERPNKSVNGVSGYANAYYDAVWSMALALDQAIPELQQLGLSLDTAHMQLVAANETAEIISKNLQNISFEGMTGRMKYQNDTKDASTVVNIKQVPVVVSNVSILIGTYDSQDLLQLDNGTFIGDSFEETVARMHPAFSAVALLVSSLVFLFTAFQQYLCIQYYNARTVKATSPNLTHMIFSGCYLLLLASVIYVIQETMDSSEDSTLHITYGVLCNGFTLCFMMGFSLVFGTICAKSWRVYRLFGHFRSHTLRSVLILDEALVVFVCSILVLDLIVWVPWTFIDPWVLKRDVAFVQDGDMPRFESTIKCSCTYFAHWVMALASYKGILTVMVVALAILTRRIHRKEFKHTKNVNLLVYTVTLLGGITIPIFFVIQDMNIYISFTIMVAFLNTIVLLCWCCLFLPPTLPVLRLRITTSTLYIKYRRWRGENVAI